MTKERQRSGLAATAAPLLRQNTLRVLLIAAPGLTAAVAILTATAGNIAFVVVLNILAGIVISSTLFIAVGIAASRVAEERVNLVRAAERGFWNARLDMVAIQDEDSGLYTDWFFRLRLQEEIDRANRYSLHFALLVIKPFAIHQDVDLLSSKAWYGDHIRRHLRKVDLPALMQDGAIAILMTSTSLRSARSVRGRICKELSDVEPRTGIACYPVDGETVDDLIDVAADAAANQVQPEVAA